MKYFVFVLTAFFVFTGCGNDKYTEEGLLDDIMSIDYKGMSKNIHQISDKEIEMLAIVLRDYNQEIKRRNLKPIKFRDDFSLRSRPRKGYTFVNEDNNTVLSITYKEIAEGTDTVMHFVDFRRSKEISNMCVKIPSLASIKCSLFPTKIPLKKDSLLLEYPKEIGKVKIHHFELLSSKYLNNLGEDVDSAKIIQLNIDNGKIRNSTDELIEDFKKNGLDRKYVISFSNLPSSESIMINYSDESLLKDVMKIEEILNRKIAGKTRVVLSKLPRTSIVSSIISIGGISE